MAVLGQGRGGGLGLLTFCPGPPVFPLTIIAPPTRRWGPAPQRVLARTATARIVRNLHCLYRVMSASVLRYCLLVVTRGLKTECSHMMPPLVHLSHICCNWFLYWRSCSKQIALLKWTTGQMKVSVGHWKILKNCLVNESEIALKSVIFENCEIFESMWNYVRDRICLSVQVETCESFARCRHLFDIMATQTDVSCILSYPISLVAVPVSPKM